VAGWACEAQERRLEQVRVVSCSQWCRMERGGVSPKEIEVLRRGSCAKSTSNSGAQGIIEL